MTELMAYPLSGVHLIEASAGTGKTYTISALYVRLLLARELSVRNILVVTYTKAATEDLRQRVRNMISGCLQAFTNGEADDHFRQNLLTSIKDHQQAAARLRSALQNFDEAAIFTIHGFCQRMLRENSLESGALFDTELVPDVQDILREITADFWRMQINRFPDSFLVFIQKKIYPEILFPLLKKIRPDLCLLPEMDSSVLDEIAAGGPVAKDLEKINQSLNELFYLWPNAGKDVVSLLEKSTGLSRVSYKPEKIHCWFRDMAIFLSTPPVYAGELPDCFTAFSTDRLEKATKKHGNTPRHRFFDICRDICVHHEELTKLFNQGLIALRQQAARFVLAEFEQRKMKKNLFAYDDLLRKLHEALKGENRQMLIRRILEKYPAALIDEFQDTDPVQYDIFFDLYHSGEKKLLYIIGDPKQAIYSFRGADIFTYQAAVNDIDSNFALAENFRSEPDLIKAVNTLFTTKFNAFVYKWITFTPVSPAHQVDRTFLTLHNKREVPLQLWQIVRKGGGNSVMDKADAEKKILANLVAEIAYLIALGNRKEALIGDKPVGPRDIAVLVRENREARLVHQELTRAGIAAVQQSTEDLFTTHEAEEMQRLLEAVEMPGNENRVRSALATDMIGWSCSRLIKLEQNEKEWSDWFTCFLQYRQCWYEQGFMPMFRQFLDRHHVRGQLIRFSDGERRLTNVLHLSEVLHDYERCKNASPAILLAWLAEQIAGRDKSIEEHQLRLESDAERVQIVTIHRAKGLQYPIVFCPFCWSGSRPIRDIVAFHLPNGRNKPAIDLGSEMIEDHKELARQEELAENMRLLYVALTRAVHRCYLVWGNFRGAESSALAWLLHGMGDFAAIKKGFKQLSDEQIAVELAHIAAKSEGSIEHCLKNDVQVYKRDLAGQMAPPMGCRTFNGNVQATQVTSFSAITSHGRLGESFIPRDELAGATTDEASIFAFPKGAAPGTFLHDVFEHLDFPLIRTEPETVRQLVATKLAQHGFAPKWEDTVMHMINHVLSTPLIPGSANLVLQSVIMANRLNELEFCFPISAVSAGAVKEVLLGHGFAEAAADWLDFSVGRGFLKGFIDLTFDHDGKYYLVDWKSNHLGIEISDYFAERLSEVMLKERYTLQSLLYTVALHQYLTLRMKEYNYTDFFGGLFYIFLRGVKRENGVTSGVYHDLPDYGLIEALSRVLVAT